MLENFIFERAPLDAVCAERREFRSNEWLNRHGSLLVSRLARRWITRARSRSRFLEVVNGAESGLLEKDENELRQCAAMVGLRIRKAGFQDTALAEAFAIIREVSRRRLGLRHYDEQLTGGWLMAKGMVAEMATGEGKTLTAVLPAAAAALGGIPVHIVTVNDYLAERDCELMRSVYESIGLSVGVVLDGMTQNERRAIYQSDVVYCTNKTLAFDYLRDRIRLGGDTENIHLLLGTLYGKGNGANGLLLRGLHFAIVDEVDSVLIDEARTPLIISGTLQNTGSYDWVKPALDLASALSENSDFVIFRRDRKITLTEFGYGRVADLCAGRNGIWQHGRRREEAVLQALAALHLYFRDEHYLVRDGTIQIIDPGTGRVMPDRSWGHGLNQLIEAKELCEKLSDERYTLGSISYQRFFSRYLRLAGMTGTAKEVAGELGQVYGLAVAPVPPHRPCRRKVMPERVFETASEKWRHIAERVKDLHARNIPVLIGTGTVAASERAVSELAAQGLSFDLLSAKQDADEANVIARAGQPGTITIATNMAGRGTDIKLGDGVDDLGGLHVILSERHEAARIDRQFAGRCARQGDSGSVERMLSLEDDLLDSLRGGVAESVFFWLVAHCNERLCMAIRSGWIRYAQYRVERQHAAVRAAMLKSEQQIDDMLSFSGQRE